MRERILEFVKKKGPVVPIDVAQELRVDSVIASAYLSECLSSKALVLSHLKVGTSRLYYLPEQKEMLEQYVDSLHPREKEAYALLKQKKVLRESTLTPQERVAIREVKDFAVPLEVTFPDRKEIFWRWYNVSNEEASALIKGLMGTPKPVEPEPVKEAPQPKIEAKTAEVEKPRIHPPIGDVQPKPVEPAPQPKIEPKVEEKPVEPTPVKVEPKPAPVVKEKVKEEAPQPKEESKEPEEEKPKKSSSKKSQKTLDNKEVPIDDPYVDEVKEYFAKENIEVLHTELIKANSEVYFTILMPTPFGDMQFFVNAKNKKRLNETDLMGTFAQGTLKKLPAILLSKGELTKKAQAQLEKEFKGLIFSSF